MVTSETTKSIYQALIKARSTFKTAIKESENDYFKSNYADYQSVVDAVSESLIKNGLSFLQPTVFYNDKICVATRIIHESGEWLECLYPITPMKQDPQAIGSATTYARRYSLASMLGVVVSDDDGEQAMARTKEEVKPKPNAPKASPRNETPVSANDVSKFVNLLIEAKISESEAMTKVKSKWPEVKSFSELKVYQMTELVKELKK